MSAGRAYGITVAVYVIAVCFIVTVFIDSVRAICLDYRWHSAIGRTITLVLARITACIAATWTSAITNAVRIFAISNLIAILVSTIITISFHWWRYAAIIGAITLILPGITDDTTA